MFESQQQRRLARHAMQITSATLRRLDLLPSLLRSKCTMLGHIRQVSSFVNVAMVVLNWLSWLRIFHGFVSGRNLVTSAHAL